METRLVPRCCPVLMDRHVDIALLGHVSESERIPAILQLLPVRVVLSTYLVGEMVIACVCTCWCVHLTCVHAAVRKTGWERNSPAGAMTTRFSDDELRELLCTIFV